MKSKLPVPTPSELAAFVRARENATIDSSDRSAFKKAIAEWRTWEQQIAAACKEWDELEDSIRRNHSRTSFAEVTRILGSPKVIRSYWEEIFPIVPGDWLDRKINGFPQHEIDQMEKEQKRRRAERARKGAIAKIVPSKSKYSNGWSSVANADLRSSIFNGTPLGTAQLFNVFPLSRRKS